MSNEESIRVQKELESYVMPECDYLSPVLFHPSGSKVEGEAKVAFLHRRHNASIDLILLEGTRRKLGVYHISDPRLSRNDRIHEDGAWEQPAADLTKRVEELEKQVEELKAKPKTPTKRTQNKPSES